MNLIRDDIWIATAMAELARASIRQTQQPYQAFICYWAAFANLYSILASQAGLRPHFGLHKNGTLRIQRTDTLKMAEVYPPTEEAQIHKAFESFNTTLNHQLIVHEATAFFVYRTPTWRNTPVRRDKFGQRLNGVLNIACTLDTRYPVWSPIDIKLYEGYTRGTLVESEHDQARVVLGGQILDMLHTVQKNLLHAAVGVGENAQDLVGKALPLLSTIVLHFAHEA